MRCANQLHHSERGKTQFGALEGMSCGIHLSPPWGRQISFGYSRVKQHWHQKVYLFQNKMDVDDLSWVHCHLVALQKQLMINFTTHLNPFSLQHSKHSSRDPCPAMRMEMLTRLILGVFWLFFQRRMINSGLERAGKWMMRLFFELGLFAI